MKPRVLDLVSPQGHRRIDLLTLPALLVAAAVLARRDRRAAGVVLVTAAVEGLATATTNYPPPVVASAIGFRAHNRWAASHGVLVAGLAAWLPGLTPLGRRALAVLSVMPITLALLSDESAGGEARTVPSQPRAGREGRRRLGSSANAGAGVTARQRERKSRHS